MYSNPTIHGEIMVAYAVERTRIDEAKNCLARVLALQKPSEDEKKRTWETPVAEWMEKDPSKRLAFFEESLGGWSNPDQRPIFETSITSFSAELQQGNLLPFQLLTIRFGLTLSTAAAAPNNPKHLIFLTQKCRDITGKLLGGAAALGEVVVTTTEGRAEAQLQELKAALAAVRSTDSFPETLKHLPADVKHPPPGVMPSRAGFSHVQIARNLHAVIAPLTDNHHNGPGWIIHVYEQADQTYSPNWGTRALTLIDPLSSRLFRSYVEERLSGIALLLVLWNWVQGERAGAGEDRAFLLDNEERLRRPLALTAASWSWRPLSLQENQGRRRAFRLRTIRREYAQAMTQFLGEIEEFPESEVWIPGPGDEALPARRRAELGVLARLVRETKLELDHVIADAEETWEFAKAQQFSYKIRVERFLGFALLAFALIEAAQFLLT